MESPVVLDKPPEYHGNERGFPFEDEEASGAWSELAARHPDIAARLRQRPASATWARKRRPSSQDATDDYGENFGSFDRFPFDDIPPEFREHFPSHWNRGFGSREEAPPPPPPPAPPAHGSPPAPQHTTAGTQTECPPPEAGHAEHAQSSLPQYGLRNTVDLGQKSPADPSLVDAEERSHRSMSAPPAARPPPPDMSSPHAEPADTPSNVRVIPIFVEGRDEPVVPRAAPHHPPAPAAAPPHIDRDHYFSEDAAPSFHHPPNFSRTFTTPSTKGFRQGPQPFMQQKAYPQAAFNRGASPQRAPSPKRPTAPAHEEHFVKVPVQHEHSTPSKPAAPPHAAQPQHPAQAPHREQTPPPAPPKTPANDPITQILSIQTDVLNLMNEVENFTGSKKDKRYLFLDEMLTRNLIKLDNIETEGKENIRLARREAIKCIQKCIAVLEAKADKNGKPQAADVDMPEVKNDAENGQAPAENGEVEMKEEQASAPVEQVTPQANNEEVASSTHVDPIPPLTDDQPSSSDTQPQQPEPTPSEPKPQEQLDQLPVEDKPSPKKKVVKKRDKSKDKVAAESVAAPTDSDKVQENVEVMQVDNKGDKTEQVMEVDGAASQ